LAAPTLVRAWVNHTFGFLHDTLAALGIDAKAIGT
jgi:hypothetical protein